MYLKSLLGFFLSHLSLVASQSYSFGIAVDNPDPLLSFSSSPFSVQRTFTPTNSRAPSRGASRMASGSASGRPSSRTDQKSSSHSISSFVFSGLDDSVSAQQTPRWQEKQFQRQSQQQQQQQQQQQFQYQPQQQQQFYQQQPFRNVQRQWATPVPEENEINELTIGKSPCARGTVGHECRMHLMATAMSCTLGKCHECQQCGSVPAKDWIVCCRDHFLCCRPLARSCQRCDQPSIAPFCNTAFGKCE